VDKEKLEAIKKFIIRCEKTKKMLKKKYYENSGSGKCPKCGKAKPKKYVYEYCIDCRKVGADYYRKNKKRICKKRRDVYAERKRNRQCPLCAVRLPKNYKRFHCEDCLEKKWIIDSYRRNR